MRYRGKIKNLDEAINKAPQVGDVFYNISDEQNYTIHHQLVELY